MHHVHGQQEQRDGALRAEQGLQTWEKDTQGVLVVVELEVLSDQLVDH